MLSQFNRDLVLNSSLRVVLVCGENAKKVLLPEEVHSIILRLQSDEYQAWLEIQDHAIQRLYLESPAPLSALWENRWPQAKKLSKAFHFAAVLTETTGVFP